MADITLPPLPDLSGSSSLWRAIVAWEQVTVGSAHREATKIDEIVAGMLRAYAEAALAQSAQPTPDPEALIRACIPGGSVCDPQQVADAIRRYLDAWPQSAQAPAQPAPDAWIGEIARQWDGCMYDAGPGGDIDIGASIRSEWDKRQTLQGLAQPAPSIKAVTINAYQLRVAAEFAAPGYETEPDTRDTDVCIERLPAGKFDDGDGRPEGLYVWLSEYPEEGCMLLELEPAAVALARGAR